MLGEIQLHRGDDLPAFVAKGSVRVQFFVEAGANDTAIFQACRQWVRQGAR
jgi:hypothetical protein